MLILKGQPLFSVRKSSKTTQLHNPEPPERSRRFHTPALVSSAGRERAKPTAGKHRRRLVRLLIGVGIVGAALPAAPQVALANGHSLEIDKRSDAAGTFTVRVTCDDLASSEPNAKTISTGTVTITVAQALADLWVPVTMTGPFSGVNCVATEPELDLAQWEAPTIDMGTPDEGLVIGVAVTNRRKPSTLVISKTSVGAVGTFAIQVNCAGGVGLSSPETITTVTAGVAVQVAPIPLALGITSCTVTESGLNNMWTPSFAPAGTVQIVGGVNNIAITNTRKTYMGLISKSFTIGHELDILPLLTPSLSFPFTVSCGEGEGPTPQTFKPVIRSNSLTSSVTFGPVFAESGCDIKEDPAEDWTQTEVEEVFVNERKTSSQTITKTLDAPATADITFAFAIKDCMVGDVAYPAQSAQITIPKGSSGPVTSPELWMPTGTKCSVHEEPQSEYIVVPSQELIWGKTNGTGITFHNIQLATTTTTTTALATTTTTAPPSTTVPSPATSTSTSTTLPPLVFETIPPAVSVTTVTTTPTTTPTTIAVAPTSTAVTIPAVILAASVPTTTPPNVEGIQESTEPAYTGSTSWPSLLLASLFITLGSAFLLLARRRTSKR
jgi:Domain of unknown function (DUF5979)